MSRAKGKDSIVRNAFAAAVLACASVAALTAIPVQAHVVVGDRVFPVTLTFDDPGVGDEATLPQFVYPPTPGGQTEYQFLWEYDKTITPATAIIYNQGFTTLEQQGLKTHTGIENAVVTGKWQAITLPQTETVASLGVMYEFGGGAATVNVGGDATGATLPTFYFGQGLGKLPIGLLRPLAITGELSYSIPDRLATVQHPVSAIAGEALRDSRILRPHDSNGRVRLVLARRGTRIWFSGNTDRRSRRDLHGRHLPSRSGGTDPRQPCSRAPRGRNPASPLLLR
jgi:hypothetical protein